MGLLKELRLRFRATKRIGAFSHACKQGMSVEQARAYSDNLYPPTAEDIEYESQLRQGKPNVSVFPRLSAISLLYPVAAMAYIATRTPVAPSIVVGYGVANLAYLLLVAGVLSGKFGVFGLKKRWQVFALSVVFFVFGTYLSNISA